MWITRGYNIITPRFTATLIPPKLQCGIDVEKTLPHHISLTTKYSPKFKKINRSKICYHACLKK